MIIRAWVEEGSSKPLRAHIRLTGEVSAGFEQSLTLTESGEVCALVDAWLHEVSARHAPVTTPRT